MSEVERISVRDTRALLSGEDSEALLVCAYRDEGKCRKFELDGSLTLQEFQKREPSLDSDQTVIFFCD